jgi:VIT1/CCC1 family predicted Fe2+/Mn2+ transporter
MSNLRAERRASVLDPVERVSEVVFGLLMALAITGSLSVASAGREEVRTMMFAALGCNVAWGLVDGIMYLVQTLTEKTRVASMVARLRATTSTESAHALLADALPGQLGIDAGPQVLEALRQRLLALPEASMVARLRRDDYAGAFGVFLLVVLSTFPVVIPFVFIDTLALALRVSHVVSVAMLFLGGWLLGRYSGGSPLKGGLALAAIGTVLAVAIAALGG